METGIEVAGRSAKLGKLSIGIDTGCKDGNSGSSSFSSRMRDSRGGADVFDRIFPPALLLLLIGVLATTSRSSLTNFLAATGGAGAGDCAIT